MSTEKNNPYYFLKSIMSAETTVGSGTSFKTNFELLSKNKIKMITANEKLVVVDKSMKKKYKIKKNILWEIFAWMDSKHKSSSQLITSI